VKAYVLVQTEANRQPIAHTLRNIPGVVAAEDLSGPFDAIALAASESMRGLGEQVVAEIQRLPGVIRALSAPLVGSLVRSIEPGGGTARDPGRSGGFDDSEGVRPGAGTTRSGSRTDPR
jgi:hypothetical protein